MKKITVNTTAIQLYMQDYIEEHDLTYSETLLIADFLKDLFENHKYKEAK